MAHSVPEAAAAGSRTAAAVLFSSSWARWESRAARASRSFRVAAAAAGPQGSAGPGGSGGGAGHIAGHIADHVAVPDGAVAITAPLAARVWSLPVDEGASVAADDVVVVLEAMKTETALRSPAPGSVTRLLCAPGDLVTPGRILALVEPEDPA